MKGDTDLKGGAITSTDKAVQENKNTFTTGGQLTTSDIQNSANYSAKAVGATIGTSQAKDGTFKPAGNSAGIGSDKGSASSTTQAGISGIAGNTAARTGDVETGINKIFDAEKVQKEIDAQVLITRTFGAQASKAVGDYSKNQRKALQDQIKQAGTDEERQQLQQAIKDVNMQERALNILVGALTGMGGVAMTKEGLSAAAEEMRQLTIEDSKKFPGITDGKTILNNVSGESEGVRSDGIKGGGTRVDLDNICGPANERCLTTTDENGKQALLLKDGMVQWKKNGAGDKTLAEYLDSPEAQKAAGATGGIQGWKGTLFGTPYAAGSWQDKLIEAFGGTHDHIGGKLSGLYDEQGNTKRGMSDTERFAHDRVSRVSGILCKRC